MQKSLPYNVCWYINCLTAGIFFNMSKRVTYLRRLVISWLGKCCNFCLLIVLQGGTHSKWDRKWNNMKSSVYNTCAQGSPSYCVLGGGLLQAFCFPWFLMIGVRKQGRPKFYLWNCPLETVHADVGQCTSVAKAFKGLTKM